MPSSTMQKHTLPFLLNFFVILHLSLLHTPPSSPALADHDSSCCFRAYPPSCSSIAPHNAAMRELLGGPAIRARRNDITEALMRRVNRRMGALYAFFEVKVLDVLYAQTKMGTTPQSMRTHFPTQ